MLKLEHFQKVEDLEKQLEDSKERSSIEDEENRSEIVTLKRKIEQMETVLEAAQQDADAHKQLAEELSNLKTKKKRLRITSNDCLFVLFLENRLSEKNSVDRELEMKKQELRKAQLQIKELEFDRETYLEFKQQAKVCMFVRFFKKMVLYLFVDFYKFYFRTNL